MIEITVFKNGFEVKGHANFADKGKDIVCAGVSALVQSTILSLEKFCGAVADVEEAFINAYLPVKNEIAVVLLDNMLTGLFNIEHEYPTHLRIKEEV
jgi:uncharacterized protein YsxB (DUF464 family)